LSAQNSLSNFPSTDTLLSGSNEITEGDVLEVNAHFHTPYSFSAFNNISQITEKAIEENIQILGINDFNTVTGHCEFQDKCVEDKKFPMFNIEFMGLMEEEKKKGIKINDPTNPGRIYFSGKGLEFPCKKESEKVLEDLRAVCNDQTEEMIDKTNAHLEQCGTGFQLDIDEIRKNLARELVRERHIAKAIREKVYKQETGATERLALINKIYTGHNPDISIDNVAAMENEIRSKLLKKGGVAFVEENPESFLPIEKIISWIVDAGGVPCYPTLLDDSKGNFTDFEEDYEKLLANFKKYSIPALELIPIRNTFEHVKKFVEFFTKNGIIVLLGTEHNTPDLIPLKVACADKPLDDYLKKISYEGAAVIAAHQYKVAKGEKGLMSNGMPSQQKIEEYKKLGKSVIKHYLN
jgi:predicted metal-dependent phosphoesterase TrpH